MTTGLNGREPDVEVHDEVLPHSRIDSSRSTPSKLSIEVFHACFAPLWSYCRLCAQTTAVPRQRSPFSSLRIELYDLFTLLPPLGLVVASDQAAVKYGAVQRDEPG